MLQICINGAAGRMGRRLVALVAEAGDLELAAALEAEGHKACGRDAGEVAGVGPLGVPITTTIERSPDVAIDFSEPASAVARAAECADVDAALVIGTTGLDADQVAQLEAIARSVPCVFAPNMSVGINVLANLVRQAAEALGQEYDIEIVEAHHRFKMDAPSGTALQLGRAAAEGLGEHLDEVAVYGRNGMTGERPTGEIGIHAVRAGDIVGEHTVTFATLGERIELRHTAHSRDTFVRGALRAARYVADRPPGLYSMQDVLGL